MNKTNLNKNENGQSIVEFALFLPVILLVVFVSIQISIIAYYRLVINQVLSDIARTVSVTENPDDSVCQNRINGILDFYSQNTIITMEINNTDLFSWQWIRQDSIENHELVIISCSYKGMRLPFVEEYIISDSLCYPSVYGSTSGT